MGSTRVCSGCGFENPPEMRYCGNCARLLVEQPAFSAKPVLVSTTQSLSFEKQVDLEAARRFQQAGLNARGQHRRVSILFADLSRYSELSERLERDALYELLQDLIKKLVDLVYQYEGTVDKIMGDGIMAIFGAPVALENHSERAVRAALDMQAIIRRISQDRNSQLGFELKLHIGI